MTERGDPSCLSAQAAWRASEDYRHSMKSPIYENKNIIRIRHNQSLSRTRDLFFVAQNQTVNLYWQFTDGKQDHLQQWLQKYFQLPSTVSQTTYLAPTPEFFVCSFNSYTVCRYLFPYLLPLPHIPTSDLKWGGGGHRPL